MTDERSDTADPSGTPSLAVPRPGGSARTGTLLGVGQPTARSPHPEAPRAPLRASDLPGMIVAGKFALLRLVSWDGTSETFEAEDTLMGRRVSIRLIKRDHAGNQEVLHRFRRDAQTWALAAHPSVASVFEVGRRSDNSLYVVHELLTGPTLEGYLAERLGRIDEAEACEIVRSLAGALAAAHAQGLVHQNVRLSTVVLSRAPYAPLLPKLSDFRATAPGADPRGDVAALGSVLCELVCGESPHNTELEACLLAMASVGARAEVIDLVRRCLLVELAERPEMRAMHEELVRLTDGPLPFQATPVPRRAALVAEPSPTEITDADIEEVLEIPSDEPSVELVDEDVGDAIKTGNRAAPRLELDGDWMRGTAEVDSDFARPVTPTAVADRAANAAQRALRVNALQDALLYVEEGRRSGATGEQRGQLLLVQTIAELWLGHYEQSERAAIEAMEMLPEGAIPWHAALGHMALARMHLGRPREVPRAPDAPAPVQSASSGAQVIAACRVAVAMIRGGDLARARQLVRGTRERGEASEMNEPSVQAWLDVAFAERAAFVGDLPRELPRRASALEHFTAAADVRNACEQRAALGAGLLRAGAFEEAERMLHEALGIAEPMKLALAGSIKVHLGLAAFRQGEAERALSLAKDALSEVRASGDRYGTALCHVSLALIHALRDEPGHALAESDLGVTTAEPFPALFAHALGVRAATLLFVGRTEAALAPARRAMELVKRHGGAGEGESITRLSHALALVKAGDMTASRRSMKEARDRVVGLAARLSDPRHKKSFLERITENARTMQLGSEWLDSE